MTETEALNILDVAYEKIRELPDAELLLAHVICKHIRELPIDEAKASCFAITWQLHKITYDKVSS